MLKIMDSINDVANSFKDWILANSTNPLLWFGLLAFFLLLFAFAFRALRK